VLDSLAAYLPTAVVEADFEFMQKHLSGQAEMKPRWINNDNNSNQHDYAGTIE
jgi:predicted metalloendopeptidase